MMALAFALLFFVLSCLTLPSSYCCGKKGGGCRGGPLTGWVTRCCDWENYVKGVGESGKRLGDRPACPPRYIPLPGGKR